eukprot:m51a1_g5771 cysteine desulfurase (394) ;mRNA; f:1245141-1246805
MSSAPQQHRVYLDNNATTRVDPAVFKAMEPYLKEEYGNPSSLHQFGIEVRAGLKHALDQIYAAINADDDDDVIAVGCATEANNTVLKSIYFDFIRTGKRTQIVTTKLEHPSISQTCEFLETLGAKVVYLAPNSDGVITADAVRQVVSDNTALVSVMWANNETGLINHVADICEVAHSVGALFHTDAVQAMGKTHVDMRVCKADYLTFSAHKFHGPKGVGALYVRKGAPLVPLLHGGEQMGGRRAGTLNVAYIVGMGVAIEQACGADMDAHLERIRRLRDKLEDELVRIPGVFVIGDRKDRTPNTIFASFRGVEGEALLWDLNRAGIAASTGSACASESLEANPTITAMSIDTELSHTGIRYSLSRFTTEEDIAAAARATVLAVDRLRKISGIH